MKTKNMKRTARRAARAADIAAGACRDGSHRWDEDRFFKASDGIIIRQAICRCGGTTFGDTPIRGEFYRSHRDAENGAPNYY